VLVYVAKLPADLSKRLVRRGDLQADRPVDDIPALGIEKIRRPRPVHYVLPLAPRRDDPATTLSNNLFDPFPVPVAIVDHHVAEVPRLQAVVPGDLLVVVALRLKPLVVVDLRLGDLAAPDDY